MWPPRSFTLYNSLPPEGAVACSGRPFAARMAPPRCDSLRVAPSALQGAAPVRRQSRSRGPRLVNTFQPAFPRA
jgi:hypothetical protein